MQTVSTELSLGPTLWNHIATNFQLYHVLAAPFYQHQARWFFALYILVYFGACALTPYAIYYFQWPKSSTPATLYLLALSISALFQVVHHGIHTILIPRVRQDELQAQARLSQFHSTAKVADSNDSASFSVDLVMDLHSPATALPIGCPSVAVLEEENDKKSDWMGSCLGALWAFPILSIIPYVILTLIADCPASVCVFTKTFPPPVVGGVWTETLCVAALFRNVDWCSFDPLAASCQCSRLVYGRVFIGVTPWVAFVIGIFVLQPVMIVLATLANRCLMR